MRPASLTLGRRLVRTLLAVACLLAPALADAQLISPGRLAQAHAELEGVGNCTQCHDLGRPGISNTKCLQCHTPLRERIAERKGLHGSLGNRNCASCHKDHFGPDFAMVRFDTATFDHGSVGYTLRLAHLEAGCRSCHTPALVVDASVRAYATRHRSLARTYLGLGSSCTSCHQEDNVHGRQFGTRSCASCHLEDTWEKASRFSHDSTRYALTGRHREVACADCHKSVTPAGSTEPEVQYAGVRAQTCTTCHADYHRGAMPQRCEQCHSTEGWQLLRNRTGFEATFNHQRTAFALRGAHETLSCASCHNPRRPATAAIRMSWPRAERGAMYPAPDAARCTSCHVDAHEGALAKTAGGTTDCTSCHAESGWSPSSYDVARHNRESFELTGAHVAVPCAQCHQPVRPGGPPQFRLPGRDCASCHQRDDPHADQFAGRACTDCHGTESFTIADFDHGRTRYPLDGAHRDVACSKCHTVTQGAGGVSYVRYRPLDTSCRACHGATTPRRP